MTTPGESAPAPGETCTGRDYTLCYLRALEWRIYRAVSTRKEALQVEGPIPVPRSMFISDETAAQMCLTSTTPILPDIAEQQWIDYTEQLGDAAEQKGITLPLRDIAKDFHLTPLDTKLLIVALAPETDPRFEHLYGYLHDDATRRHASPSLALQLSGLEQEDPEARARLAHGPLPTHGLIQIDDNHRPLLSRSLRVPDRVTAHLLEQIWPTHAYRPGITLIRTPGPLPPSNERLVRQTQEALTANRLVYLHGRPDSAARAIAESALITASQRPNPIVQAEPGRAADDETARAVIAEALLEAQLQRSALLILAPPEPLPVPDTGTAPSSTALAQLSDPPLPIAVVGTHHWNSHGCDTTPVSISCPRPTTHERTTLWNNALEPYIQNEQQRRSFTASMRSYRLSPHDIRTTLGTALTHARSQNSPLTLAHLNAATRTHRAAALNRLARRIEPDADWDELILPELPKSQLADLIRRARHREQVLGDWKMRPGAARGFGATALFTGESGTGKTLAAEVVASALNLDLYHINLANVVDKYIGETEKNLDRIFNQAENIDAVLLFDEADALFGKRSETTTAHDRYANVETAYLLQRIEAFDGISLLTTNLRGNIDEAFTRRLDLIIHFPLPDPGHRRQLWEHCLGAVIPRSPDVDLHSLAAHELSGGSIRNCAVSAAYRAADEDVRPVMQSDLLEAVASELRKLGRTPPPES